MSKAPVKPNNKTAKNINVKTKEPKPETSKGNKKGHKFSDPFKDDPRFYWDYKYIFSKVYIDDSNKDYVRSFLNEISSNEFFVQNDIEMDDQKKEHIRVLDTTLNEDKFNNIYHMLDVVLSTFFSKSVIESGKSNDALYKSPVFISLCELIDKHFYGQFYKTISKDENSEEFYCTNTLKVWELEKNLYNPNLKNEEIKAIFSYLKEKFPKCIYQPNKSEELYEFDFHKLDYSQIDEINDWMVLQGYGVQKHKKKAKGEAAQKE